MSRLAAPNLEWERLKRGISVWIFILNGRLTANMDYYLKKTTDMIMSQRLPSFLVSVPSWPIWVKYRTKALKSL